VITPAISVCPAMEGLKIVTRLRALHRSRRARILVSLFMVRARGQGGCGVLRARDGGLVSDLIGTGLLHIADDPSVFAA
jgi:K+ transporter